MRRLLRIAAAAAESRGEALYLVGGCVRDLLLGAPLRDVDLVVEGDPSAVAAQVSTAMEIHATSLSPFGTCRLVAPDGLRVDLAMSRRETYSAPASLPEVLSAPIECDLLRRDFTINSIALTLTRPRKGCLIDPSMGLRDLRRRILRLHHPRSFADDPTRAFRGARFATRFSLAPDRSIWRALSEPDVKSAFSSLGPARLLREVRLIWSERDPAAVLALASRWGLLAQLHRSMRWSASLRAAIGAASRLRARDQAAADADLLIALLTESLPATQRKRFCDRLGLSGSARRRILSAASAPARAQRLELSFTGVERLAAWPEISLLVARAATSGTIRRRLDRARGLWKRSAPRLRGDDLLELGVQRGPAVGRMLHALRRGRFEGRLRTRAEETRWVRTHS